MLYAEKNKKMWLRIINPHSNCMFIGRSCEGKLKPFLTAKFRRWKWDHTPLKGQGYAACIGKAVNIRELALEKSLFSNGKKKFFSLWWILQLVVCYENRKITLLKCTSGDWFVTMCAAGDFERILKWEFTENVTWIMFNFSRGTTAVKQAKELGEFVSFNKIARHFI